jgi:hypothetical protein
MSAALQFLRQRFAKTLPDGIAGGDTDSSYPLFPRWSRQTRQLALKALVRGLVYIASPPIGPID